MAGTVPAQGVWRLRLRGHELAVQTHAVDDVTTAVVTADGRAVATRNVGLFGPEIRLSELDLDWDLESLDLGGARLALRSWRRGCLGSARVVVPTPGARPERLDLEPPVGARARRSWELQQAHPRWYAARHVAFASAQVLLGLVALSLLWRWIPWGWLPDLALPDWDLPSIPLPSVPLPDWPDWELPAWVHVVLDSKRYWFPILVAVVIATREVRRRKQRQEQAG